MPANENSCSVVIVSKQGGEALFATIESVLFQQNLAEVIIVDNGNAPDVIARLQQRAISDQRLKIISGHGDIGYARGANIGAKQATSEFLLLLKPDYLLPPDAIKTLVSALINEPRAMLTSGFVQKADGSAAHIFRTQVVTPKSAFKEFLGLAKNNEVETNKNYGKNYEVTNISACCMCIRASDYKKFGGLDVGFYEQAEELDFCLRVEQIGGRVICVPEVRITELPSANSNKNTAVQHWREARNLIFYFNKFFAEHQVIGSLFLLNIVIIIRALRKIIFSSRKKSQAEYSANEKKLLALAIGASDALRGEALAKKIILVTGATSLIGLCVVRRLIASGAAVIAIHRSGEIAYQHPHLRWMQKDLADGEFDLDGYCVDAVIHCAPLWLLPPVVKKLADSEATRIIAFSSTSIFTKILSNNDYEKELVLKLQRAEEEVAKKCAECKISYSIFRPTLTYGLGLDGSISAIASVIRRFGRMFVYPPALGRRQPVHADDLAIASLQALNNEATYAKSYNLSGNEIIPYREMLEKIFVGLGKKTRITSSTMLPFALDLYGKLHHKKYINGEIARRMNDDLVFFNDDAKRDFNFSPRKFLSGGIKDL